MNYLAHHFVISSLNECLDMCDDASHKLPDITLADAVTYLYLNFLKLERAKRTGNEMLEEHLHYELHEPSRALLYYAANTDTRRLIQSVYEILEAQNERFERWSQAQQLRTSNHKEGPL